MRKWALLGVFVFGFSGEIARSADHSGAATFALRWSTPGGRAGSGTLPIDWRIARLRTDPLGWTLGVLPEESLGGDEIWHHGTYTRRRNTLRLELDPANLEAHRDFLFTWAERMNQGPFIAADSAVLGFRGRVVTAGRGRLRARLVLTAVYRIVSGPDAGKRFRLAYRITQRLRPERG